MSEKPCIDQKEGFTDGQKAFAQALILKEKGKNGQPAIPKNQPGSTEVDGTKNNVRDSFVKWIETDEDGDIVGLCGNS